MALRTTPSRIAADACVLLGGRVREARLERRWSQRELGERLGVTLTTVRKVESGDPSVRLGTAFEAAALLGVPLFAAEPDRLSAEKRRVQERLVLLPQRARRPTKVDDAF